MSGPKRVQGKQTKQASQIGGLSPVHFEIALEQAKDGCLGFVRQITAQLPNEMFPYLPRINALLLSISQANIKS